jgi:hypothetical protein
MTDDQELVRDCRVAFSNEPATRFRDRTEKTHQNGEIVRLSAKQVCLAEDRIQCGPSVAKLRAPAVARSAAVLVASADRRSWFHNSACLRKAGVFHVESPAEPANVSITTRTSKAASSGVKRTGADRLATELATSLVPGENPVGIDSPTGDHYLGCVRCRPEERAQRSSWQRNANAALAKGTYDHTRERTSVSFAGLV